MSGDQKTYLNMVLDDSETDTLNKAKEKSGIKANADLIRWLLKAYTDEIFIHPSLRKNP